MADYINKIRTTEGDKPVNYEALANKPNSLPNPNKIKFTGSVVAEYDGSSEVTVDIQNGASEEQAAQIQTNTNDISELKGDITHSKEAIKDLSDKKITKFYASNLGETTLNDSDNGKIQDMILYGKSLQDGTPTPTSPIDIQSVVNPKIEVCGKNLLNPTLQTTTQNGVTCTNNGDGTYTLNGTATNLSIFKLGQINFKKDVTYKLVGCPNGGEFNTKYILNILGDPAFDKGDGCTYSYTEDKNGELNVDVFSGFTCNNLVFKPMITDDLSATYDDFEPCKEQSATLPYTLNAIPVDSGGNVTIDGQEYIADYVDVERGKLVRMVDKHDLGAVYWNRDVYDGNYYFYSVTSEFKSKQGYFDCLCSQYRYVSYHSVKYNDMSLAVQNNNGNQYIVLKNDIYTDASSLKSSLNGVYVYFILETPTEIDLTDEEVQAFRDLATYYPTTNVFVTSDQLDGYTEFNYPVSLAEGWNYVKQQLGDTRDYIYDMDLQSAEAYVNSEYAVALAELEV